MRTVNAPITEDGESEAWVYVRPPCVDTVASTRWQAEYFSGTTPGSGLLAVRDEGDGNLLAHDWGTGSPCSDCGVPVDNFSARFTRTITFAAGWYVFTVQGDDGVRLKVDNTVVVDGWFDHGPQSFTSASWPLTAGPHTLQLEYYDRGGEAMVSVSFASAAPPPGHLGVQVETDLNGDGVADAGAPLLKAPGTACAGRDVSGVQIAVTGASGNASGTLSVCSDSLPRFLADLPAGTYNVTLNGLPTAWTGSRAATVTLSAGGTSVVRFVVRPPGNITGRVIIDWNGNRQLDGNDTFVTIPSNPCTRSTAVDGFTVSWTGPSSGTAVNGSCTQGDGAWFGATGVPAGTYSVTTTLPPGWTLLTPQDALVVPSDQNGYVSLWVVPPPCLASVPWTEWRADFYNTTTLSGTILATRSAGTGALWQNWGAGTPAGYCGVPQDGFSARIYRDVYFSTPGVYRFTATSDDGVAVYVDQTRVVNGWWDHGQQTFTGDIPIPGGWHQVRVEYYDRSGTALVGLDWQWVSPMPQPPGTLYPNQSLNANQQLWSPNGNYFLVYQGDGNLVLYTWDGFVVWQAYLANTDPGSLVMQSDGNLVVYDGWGDARWWTGTDGHNGAYLAVQDDGNLVVYSAGGGQALWARTW